MTKLVITGGLFVTGSVDLSAWTQSAEVSSDTDEKDVTNFASGGWKEVIGGLGSGDIKAKGQWEAGGPTLPDDYLWSALGSTGPWLVCPIPGAADGSTVYLLKCLHGSFMVGGSVGDVAPFEAKGSGASPLARGQIAKSKSSAIVATGNGTGLNLGAVPAGQALHASLHVLSASGTTPSLTVVLETAAANTFASPTTRATFTAATVQGAQQVRVPGPITDTWQRLRWTVTGTTPSFLIVASIAIGE